MGLNFLGTSSSRAASPAPTDPRPDVFTILSTVEIGRFTVIKVKYPHCTTFEGIKLLVYKDTPVDEICKLKRIDPHFIECLYPSPVARFIPTDEGYAMAVMFCEIATKEFGHR